MTRNLYRPSGIWPSRLYVRHNQHQSKLTTNSHIGMLAEAYDVIVISSDDEDVPTDLRLGSSLLFGGEVFLPRLVLNLEHRPYHNADEIMGSESSENNINGARPTVEEILDVTFDQGEQDPESVGDYHHHQSYTQDSRPELLVHQASDQLSEKQPERSQSAFEAGDSQLPERSGAELPGAWIEPQVSVHPLSQVVPLPQVVSLPLIDNSNETKSHNDIVVVDLSEDEEMNDVEPTNAYTSLHLAPKKRLSHEIESDSDDEIAVLSKEEAERTGTFKATSFERPVYNQPAPVFHAGSEVEAARRYEELKIREYFERLSMQQINQHEENLQGQLKALDDKRDNNLSHIAHMRSRILGLTYEQVALRGAIMRTINENLKETEDIIKNSKKVRRYRAVLQSVKESKLFPNQHVRIERDSAPPVPFQPVNFSFDVVPEAEEYFNGNSLHFYNNLPTMAPSTSYGTNVNPYLVQNHDEDSVHLRNLFNDIYKEETIEGMAPTPDSLTIQLLDHQRKGLLWLLNKEDGNTGCILGDDMGLGKTVQTLALIMAHKSDDSLCKTTLVVGPVSLLRQWAAEMLSKVKIEHRLKVGFYHGADKKKLNTFLKMARYDIILTSYTTLASEFKQHYEKEFEDNMVTKGQNVLPDLNSGGQNYVSPFFAQNARFYRIVLDEAQYIKNKLSQTSKATACLKGLHRLCLTGTPMQNSIDELYPILRFLKVRPYDDESKFKRDISVPIKANNDEVSDYRKVQSMQKLRAVLLAIMLRRTKDSKDNGKPLVELPKKEVKSVFVSMDDEERKLYKDLELGVQKKARKLLQKHGKSQHTDILTLLLRLRQACIHQFLVQVGELNAQEKNNGPDANDWKRMFRLISSMSDTVKSEIEAVSHGGGIEVIDDEDAGGSEAQLTCPICLDVVGSENILIFAGCGHMICDGCSMDFFEQGIEVENSTSGNSFCMSCHQSVDPSELIEYPFYQKVVYDGYNFERLSLIFDSTKRVKTTNTEKITRLVRENNGFTPSAKMNRTLDLIKEIISNSEDEKIIIFSHFTTTFDLMGYALKQEHIKYLRYDGTMNIDLKNATIKAFYEGPSRVLLLSLKAGNVGLTLTCASHVIIMDPFWNPFVEDQAMDRAHRFGQTKPVNVYKLLIRDSVEDRILDLQERKKEVINAALDEKELKNSSHLGRRELGYLFGLNTLGLVT